MATMIDEFQTHLNQRDLSALTIRGYVADLRHFKRWFEQSNGEALAVDLITPIDVKDYKHFSMSVERRKASTVNRRLAALSALARWGQESGLIQSDPTKNIKSVPSTAPGPRWLDKRQQHALIRAVEKDLQLAKSNYPKRWLTRQRDASLVLFLLHTGLRLNEVTQMQLDDVQLSERKGSVLVRQGKGNKQRLVPLNTEARKALGAWLDVRPEGESAFVWVAVEAATKKLSGRAVQRIMERYGQQAGIQNLTPHVARHTFAKNLVDQGVGLEKVASLLGHSSLNTTRVYIVPSERDLERAVECLV